MQMLRMGKLGGIVKFLPSNLQVSETEENKKRKAALNATGEEKSRYVTGFNRTCK